MQFIETLRIVFVNLLQNKFKVILTSLGIIVGSVTIILVIAIGQGGEQEIASQFGDLSAATLYVNPNYTKGFFDPTKPATKLTPEIIEQIKEENPYLDGLSLRYNGYQEIKAGNETQFAGVTGVYEDYARISNLNTQFGDNFTEDDIENAMPYGVIGESLAKKLFGSAEAAMGQTVKIGNYSFTIIGVLERKGDGIQGLDADNSVFIPYTFAERYLMGDYDIPQVVGLAKDIAYVNQAIERIKSTLDYVLDDSSLYTVEDAGSRIEAATQSATTMKMLLISVAAIVFIVGGIGIMNVLFVSVRERTREIGILKALGSKKGDILKQFLFESVSISLLGGLVGVLLSFLLMPLMERTDIPVFPTLQGYVVALLFAVITGTVFGFYPAYKASRLKPIEALNFE